MKQLLFLSGFAAIILISCNKDTASSSNQLSGKWRMVEVYDKNTSSILLPPAENGNDLVLNFTTTGFSGHTLRNAISEGVYTIPEFNKVRFTAYSTTQIAEDSWGGILFTVLNACFLQSVAPCTPLDFSIHGSTMDITTPLRYNIKLQRY